MFTAHNGLLFKYPAEAYEFTLYYWLSLAYQQLGMPHSETEQAFDAHYLSTYFGEYIVDLENFKQRYYECLKAKFYYPSERKTLDTEEIITVIEWRQCLIAEEDGTHTIWMNEEIDQEEDRWKSLQMKTGVDQETWDEKADEREARQEKF